MLLAVGLAAACPATAGEDSTDHWGAGGAGPAWYQAPCTLAEFVAAVDHSEFHRCAPRPERRASEERLDRPQARRADQKAAERKPVAAGLKD